MKARQEGFQARDQCSRLSFIICKRETTNLTRHHEISQIFFRLRGMVVTLQVAQTTVPDSVRTFVNHWMF